LLLLACGAALAVVGLGATPGLGWAAAMAAVLAVAAVAGPGGQENKVKVELQRDNTGKPRVFALSVGNETVSLDPGKNWLRIDEYKWVTRGLIEAPQSFHVLPNGTVDINDEKISLEDREGVAKLEREINKRRAGSIAPRELALARAGRPATPAAAPEKICFHVKMDPLCHFTFECAHGQERVETGLRGLLTLVQSGLMLKPKSMRVDPLQRYLELDGVRYECTPAGAQQLEQSLNDYYAPFFQQQSESAVEIKENPASATGFDIRFVTVHAGARFETKGHLSQEKLDILQDPAKCDLLHPGILLRLSPPYLLVRRRRSDGGEEHVAGFADLHYRRATAAQLQELFNHPLIHRTAGGSRPAAVVAAADQRPAELVELRVARNPQNTLLLWLECVTTKGGPPERKALTYHNIVDLQHQGVFQPHLDVTLSLDNRTLGILNEQTRHEHYVTITSESTDEELKQASQALTAALKPPAAPPAAPHMPPEQTKADAPVAQAPQELPSIPLLAPSTQEAEPPSGQADQRHPPLPTPSTQRAEPLTSAASAPLTPPPEAPPPAAQPADTAKKPAQAQLEAPPTVAPPAPAPEQALAALFRETDAVRVNTQVLRRLGARLGVRVQDVVLSLPRVFTDRRFQIVSFSHPEVNSILELRSEAFYGFYLSHNDEQNVLLVYACKGRHLEWGPKRCLLQAALTSEPDEFKGTGLLGLAQSRSDHFVFVVRPEYNEWARGREKAYEEVYAHFITVKELAANRDNYTLIWPEPPATA
jgi:hypothetical protein